MHLSRVLDVPEGSFMICTLLLFISSGIVSSGLIIVSVFKTRQKYYKRVQMSNIALLVSPA